MYMHKCIPCEGYFIVPCERHPGVEVLFVLIIHPGLYYTPVVAFFKIRLNSRQNEIEMKLNWVITGLSNTPVVRVHHVATLRLRTQVAKVIRYLQQILLVPSIIYNILKYETRGTIVVGMIFFWQMSTDDDMWVQNRAQILDFRL